MSGLTHVAPDAVACAVTTHGLTRRYGSAAALDRVDLRIPEGAVYVLIGANGAGKSTTLKLLMNLERADDGIAHVFGLDTVRQGPEVRAQVGYVPEHRIYGHSGMSSDHLLRHAASYYPTWDSQYAGHLCRALGPLTDRRIGTLSKGEARRLQLVLALAHRPLLLLLDEPTDGLDPVVRKRTWALLAEHLADTPATVLITTHQVYEVESLADHMGVLRQGRLVAQMGRDELRRTVRRYRVDVPEGWDAPAELRPADVRRSSAGREVQCTLIGEERDVAARLAITGAQVRDVAPVALEDAAIAFLSEEPT